MFFVFGCVLLWWGALGDLMFWGVLAGGGSYVLEGCSSVLGPAVSQTVSPNLETQAKVGRAGAWFFPL